MAAIDLDTDAALADILERMADELRTTGNVDVSSWQARHPEFASELVRLVPTLGLLANLSSPSVEANSEFSECYVSRTLGDFRILRELGRGGMGIVYEAEQLSLNRRVALKILPTAAVLDPRTLQRFKNEAQAAAALDHPHIVDVYGVGAERGVHYYAMRLIDGCTLADVIADIRAAEAPAREGAPPAEPRPNPQSEIRNPKSVPTTPLALLSTIRSTKKAAFFRSIAELGLHVADALAHAHQQGVIHRDIKPSNLLLDSQGKVWITDFGLAHIEANPTLTASGDLLGTLRYMSPEQALANRAPIDHRTDIYSLGATLYELITLQPLFGDSDRAALVHKIAFSEPTPPRKLNPRIPADLETILLKMLEKDPAGRYATAGDLAADLRRFAENQPIQAHRPTLAQRTTKWAVRNRSLVLAATLAALFVSAVAGALLGWQARDAAARRTTAEQIAAGALELASEHEQNDDWLAAFTEIQRAQAALTGQKSPLAKEIELRLESAHMAVGLDHVRMLAATTAGGDFDFAITDQAYAQSILGLNVRLPRQQFISQLRKSRIRLPLADALTNWSIVRMRMGTAAKPTWQELLAIAKEADPDPWRNRLREVYEPQSIPNDELADLIERAPIETLPRATLFLLVQAAGNRHIASDSVRHRLQTVQRLHPYDFWINFALARYFDQTHPSEAAESIRYYSAALALRPGSAAVLNNLGVALVRQKKLHEAADMFRQSIARAKDFPAAYSNLSYVLCEDAKFDEAEQLSRQALRMYENFPEIHCNLARALLGQGMPKEAEAAYRRALELRPGFPAAEHGLEKCLAASVSQPAGE